MVSGSHGHVIIHPVRVQRRCAHSSAVIRPSLLSMRNADAQLAIGLHCGGREQEPAPIKIVARPILDYNLPL